MSHNFSNIYAARVFAEHPLALWSLDDEIYYVSTLSENYKDVENWLIEGSNAQWQTSYSTPTNVPLKNESKGVLRKNSSASVTYSKINSASIAYSSLDSSKDTICISAFVYAYGALIDNYEIGFVYSNGTTSRSTLNSVGSSEWQTIQHTSLIPVGASAMPYLKINYIEGGSLSDYDVMINSVSVGQWSELFLYDSSGIVPSALTDISLDSLVPSTNYSVASVDSYGFNDSDNGYVFIDNGKLLSYNTSLPMVFGSGNLTEVLSPITSGMPSIAIPGKGFLNKTGQYSEMTMEFWLRINPNVFEEVKIFGPLATDDGLYVDDDYLTLKIGRYTKSYFIGKWYRPMLVHIRYSQDFVSVLINGDVVIEIDLDSSLIDFPPKNVDWLGFFGNENVYPFQLDCIAIYPYTVPDQLAKKRFIFGQAVSNAEAVTNNFGGESSYIDFPFAQYTSTINYPDMNAWNSGYFNNLNANSKYIGFQNYDLPEFRFSGQTGIFTTSVDIRDWSEFEQKNWLEWLSYSWLGIQTEEASDILTDNFLKQVDGEYPFIKMRPSDAYNNVDGSIEFDSINPITDRVASIYGVFQAPPTLSASSQVIMNFKNSINNNTFEVTLDNSGLKYAYNNIVLSSASVAASANFAVGIDIDKLSINYGNVLGNFFSSPQNLSLSLMGYANSTFLGKFFNITFNNSFFNQKDMTSIFNEQGIASTSVNNNSFEYTGNYTLKPLLGPSSMTLDVCSAGYWEDSIPLSYFGKLIKSKSGLEFYDLDMIQFNVEYPSQVLTNPSSSANYHNHDNLKSYITLQSFDEVGKTSYSRYTNTVQLTNNRVLDFDNTTDVIDTKFEVADGTIIFPPKELVDFSNYYITIHLELKVQGVNSKPLQIKRMSLSSLANDESDFFSINTRTGNKIYPISRYDRAYSYKDKNPFTIYKDSTPYLYLTGDSGISILPYTSQSTRAFSIPVNNKKISSYSLGGFQIWCMYNEDATIGSVKKVGRVSTPDRTFDIYLDPIDNGSRALMKVFDAETGFEDDQLTFYQNGVKINHPVIYPMIWSSIVFSFGETIILDGVSGQLELYQGFLYNNVTIYQKSTEILGQRTDARTWQEVRASEAIIGEEIVTIQLQWEDWSPTQWGIVYAPTTSITFTIDGESIMGSYLGTSSIVSDDSSVIELNSDGVDIISDVTWDTTLVKPV
jgi:hypothetical protein